MLFDFALRDIDEIQPWGTPPRQSLSWFALTDGYYRLNVGGNRLFEYSAIAARQLLHKYPDAIVDRVDYQVARLWENVLEILPDVLEPIPESLVRLLTGPAPTVREWSSRFWSDYEQLGDEEAEAKGEIFQQATVWLSDRHLDSRYLIAGPNIWFWSTPEVVGITWDNRDRNIEGVQAWSAVHGSFQMPRETFLADVRDFNDRFIQQMTARVDEVCRREPIPGVDLDLDDLRSEHAQRERFLNETLTRKPTNDDWPSVLRANEQVNQWRSERSGN